MPRLFRYLAALATALLLSGLLGACSPEAPSEPQRMGAGVTINPNSQIAGMLPVITIRPLDGTSDDGPRLAALITAQSGKGCVQLMPGLSGEHFKVLTDQELTGKSPCILGTPDTVLDMALTLDASLTHYAFYVRDTADVSVTSTTLAATPAVGSISVQTHGTVAAGKYIRINGVAGDFSQIFKVVSVAGAGDPYTLTLDAPTAYTFASGDAVAGSLPPINPRFLGGGMKITGSGSAAIAFAGAQRGEISDVNFDGTWDWGPFFWDIGSRDVVSRRINIASNTSGNGIGVHGVVGGALDQITVRKVASQAISVLSSREVSIHAAVTDGADKGLVVASIIVGGSGSRDIAVSDSYFGRSTTYGAAVNDGSLRVGFVNTGFSHGAGSGLIVAATGGTTPDGVHVTNSFADGNAQAGFYALSGILDLVNSRAEKNGSADAYGDLTIGTSGTVNAINFVSIDPVGNNGILNNGVFRAAGLDVRCTRGGAWRGVYNVVGSGATASIDGFVATGTNSNVGSYEAIRNRANILYLANASQTGCDFGVRDFEVAGKCWRGPNVRLVFAGAGTYNTGAAMNEAAL